MIRTKSAPAVLLGFLVLASSAAKAQTQPASPTPLPATDQTTTPSPSVQTAAAPTNTPAKAEPKKPYQPRCSTEKVNGNCYVNINRLYPYSYPGFLMKPHAKVAVNVFNPFSFEKLTVEPSAPANIYESTDQFGSLVTAIAPATKGNTIDGTTFINMFADTTRADLLQLDGLPAAPSQTAADLEKEIKDTEKDLNELLDDAVTTYIDPYTKYKNATNEIYRQVRLVSLAVPRPEHDPDLEPIRQALFESSEQPDDQAKCFSPSDPWHSYNRWRSCMIRDLLIQGNRGTALWSLFPNKCQAGPSISPSPWTVPTPTCQVAGDVVEPAFGPRIDPSYDSKYSTLRSDLIKLSQIPGEQTTCEKFKETAASIEQRHDHIASFLSGILGAVPATLTKISTDMQNFYIALLNAPDTPRDVISLGVLYGPSSLDSSDKKVRKYLGVPIGLAPAITYNVNGQNLVTNTLLSSPATTQRTLVAAIPLTFAAPRFETSSGVFLSWLNNRTFANTTEVTINTTGTTPTPMPTDVKITETATNRPLLIPYFAAHYRISPEWLWPGGRRGALYVTGALGINPYLTDLEYAAGFGISWRYLMFSPVYHLGRSTHLTQGEQVGQIWCVYSSTASATTNPPSCGGAPPAPTTKNYLTGAFAFGIGVRIPTTFSSTNH